MVLVRITVLCYSYPFYLFGTHIVLLLVPVLSYLVPVLYWYSYRFYLFGNRTSAQKIKKQSGTKAGTVPVPYRNIRYPVLFRFGTGTVNRYPTHPL
ncbi:hypothetical protein HanRHA438_Chr12g0533691 [Helianthus annuus]|nr:hypothetical protein HanRHA438_Chr12g0533691 [Helianthus annuus]